MMKWRIIGYGTVLCPGCGSWVEAWMPDDADIHDGAQARCEECHWHGYVSVCEDGNYHIVWDDIFKPFEIKGEA